MGKNLKIAQVDAFGQPFQLSIPAFAGGLKDPHMPEIFNWLAKEVINQPYKDLPLEYQDILGHRIYRPNHDIAHSMRQVMYLQVLQTWVMKYGKAIYQDALKEVTPREWNLLSLASFLFRSGRTNEQSSKSGLSQNKNSAEIFKAVAGSLGFPSAEVELLAWCIENYAPLTSEMIESMPFNTPKSRLFNGLLLLAHNGDLPRCWPDENEIGLSTRDNFTALMQLSGAEINQLHESYLTIARLLCNVTGTGFFWPSQYGHQKFHPHVIYKQMCVSRFDDAWAQLDFYTGCVVQIIKKERSIGQDGKKTLELMEKSQNLAFGGGLLGATITLQQAFFSRKAGQKRKMLLGMGVSSSHSMRRLRKEFAGQPLSEGEHRLMERLESYPWVIKHAIPTRGQDINITEKIQESMVLKSSDDLGGEHHTDFLGAGTGYVYFSIGREETPVADFLKPFRPDIIFIRVGDFLDEGRLTTPLVHMILNAPRASFVLQETFFLTFQGHSLEISYQDDQPEKKAQKTIKVTWPNGETRERVLLGMDEAVEGTPILQWLAMNLVVMLRMMSPECQSQCQQDETLLNEFIDLVCHVKNYEVLIPRKLLLTDPRIQFCYYSKSASNLEEIRKKIEEAFSQGYEALRLLFADKAIEPNFLLGEDETLLQHLLITKSCDLTVRQQVNLAKILIDRGAKLRAPQIPSIIARLIQIRRTDLASEILNLVSYDLKNDIDMILAILMLGNDEIFDEYEALGMLYHEVPLSLILDIIESYPSADEEGVALIKRLQRSNYPFDRYLKNERMVLQDKVVLVRSLGYIKLVNQLEGVGVRFAKTEIEFDNSSVYCYIRHPQFGVIGVKYVGLGILKGYRLPLLSITSEISEANLRDLLFPLIGYRMQSFTWEIRGLTEESRLCLVNLLDLQPRCFPTDRCEQVKFISESEVETLEEFITSLTSYKAYHDAVVKGDVARVRELIQHHPQDIGGRTLYCALEKNPIDSEMLNVILSSELYDVNQLIEVGNNVYTSPLNLAIYKKDRALIGLLLEHGASMDVFDKEGITPVMAAVTINSISILTYLLQCGAKLKAKDEQSLLAFACFKQCSDDVFFWLLERIDHLEDVYKRYTALNLVIKLEEVGRVEALLKRGADTRGTNIETGRVIAYDLDKLAPHLLPLYQEVKNPPLIQKLGVNGLLALQGHGKEYDLNHALKGAYGIVEFMEVHEFSLLQLLIQLRQDARLPESVELCFSLYGKEAVVPCVGIDRPTLALNLDYLSIFGNQTTYLALVFAVRLQYECILTGKMKPFLSVNTEDFLRLDLQVLREFNLPYEDVVAILQNQASYLESYEKAYFEWPNAVNSSHSSRLKALLYGMQLPKSGEVQVRINDRDLAPAVFQAKELIQAAYTREVSNLGDLTLDDCSRVMDSITEEVVLPDFLCPTLSFRTWVFLEAVMAKLSDTEFINSLLRLMVDKKFYAITQVYARLITISKHGNWGYIVDYQTLQDKLRFAESNLFNWEDWAEQVHALHQKMRGLYVGSNAEMFLSAAPDCRHEVLMPVLGDTLTRDRYLDRNVYYLVSLPPVFVDSSIPFKSRKFVDALFLMGFFDERMLDNMDEGILDMLKNVERNDDKYEFFRRKIHHRLPLIDPNIVELWQELTLAQQEKNLNQLLSSSDSDLQELFDACLGFPRQVLKPDYSEIGGTFTRMLTEAKQNLSLEAGFKNMLLSPDCIIYRLFGDMRNLKYSMIESIFNQFPHWRFEEKLHILAHSSLCYSDTLDLHLMEMIHPEWKEMNWTELLHAYRREIYRCERHAEWVHQELNKFITQYFLAICPPFHIFQEDVVDILIMLIKKNMISCLDLWLTPNANYERYPSVSICNLHASKMVPLSRILSRYAILPEVMYLLEFNELMLERIEEIEDEQAKIIWAQHVIICSEAPYHTRIADELTLTRAKRILKASLVEKMRKKDDCGYMYRRVFLDLALAMLRDFSRQDAHEIITDLSVALETQFELSQEIDRTLNPPESETRQNEILSEFLEIDRLVVTIFGNDRYSLIEYLSSSGAKPDRDKLFKIIDRFFKYCLKTRIGDKVYDNNQVRLYVMALYDYFWSCSLQQRTVLVDNLIIPSLSELDTELKAQAYQRGFDFLCNKLFEGQEASPDDEFIKSLLTSFLETALPEDKQLFLAAMFISVKETSGRKSSVGDMLVGFLENMGPAGVKLGQAAHSHPTTRADLKKSLAKLKSRANPPTREAVWSWIKERLPPEQFSRITHLGEMLGSASVHVVMACEMEGLGDVVLSLTRPNAKEDSLKAYAHFERMIRHCQHPDFNNSLRSTMLLMIEEARRMVLDEIDDNLGVKQLQAAEKLYLKKAVAVPLGSRTFTVMFHPCALVESGFGYRVLERGYGHTFSSLRADASMPRDVVKAIAIAKLKVEMTHILTNRFDSDRHEEQELIRVSGDQINVCLFDFGELGLERLSQHETDSIATLLRQLPGELMQGKEPALYLSEVIENCQKQGQPYRHFVRIQKAFLALSAYIEEVGLQGLREVFKSILFDIDVKYRNALCYGYGWSLVKQGTGWFFQQAKTMETSLRSLFNPGDSSKS